MAIIETRADDFDGSTPAETVTFYVSGKAYMIDLAEANRKELEDILARHEEELSKYIAAGRALGRMSAQSSSRSRPATNRDTAKIREWAQANGYEVADRGRIAQEIRDAYYAGKNKK
ncbi:Lsr2 family protein [Micrococcus sp. UYEF12]|uniref:histone-like nucleoid-structuring protein Lsr2 n=1 Tax=Micrococcus sp. UYEF12 TaxID=1756388 RepID=UPI00339A1C6C